MAVSSVLTFLLTFGFFLWRANTEVPVENAICVINAANISGIVQFVQTDNLTLQVTVNISGITKGKHGFHVHQYGDISKGCASAGGHFNPHSVNHGGPNSTVRHVGDLGNIVANNDGVVELCHAYFNMSLRGTHSIIGRSLVIHANEDDYGLGSHNDSLTTGHAGSRLACCSIVVSP